MRVRPVTPAVGAPQQRKEEEEEGPGIYQEEVNVAKKRQEEERMQKEKARKVAVEEEARKQLRMAAQLPPEPAVDCGQTLANTTTQPLLYPLTSTLIKTIKKLALNLCYKLKHLRRKKFKVVPFEFASVWRNLPAIFSDVESPTNTNTEDSLPVIALEKVNAGALKKVPQPLSCPVSFI